MSGGPAGFLASALAHLGTERLGALEIVGGEGGTRIRSLKPLTPDPLHFSKAVSSFRLGERATEGEE